MAFLSLPSARVARQLLLSVFVVLAVLLPLSADAATLNLQPSSSVVTVGDTFTERIRVSSPQALNAISSTLTFSPGILQVVGVSKAGSVLSLWVQDPSFSNSEGTVSFSGVVPNPGYTGSNGTVLIVTFRATRAGTANLGFSEASVLANDGLGTELLTSSPGGTVTVQAGATPPPPVATEPEPPTPQPTAPSTGTLTARRITSNTHPSQTTWYNTTNAVLSWTPSSGITGTRMGYDKQASGKPTIMYTTPQSSKTLAADEGITYFHLQERNASGWGPVSTYKLQVDVTPPEEFSIIFPRGGESTNPTPLITFKATDQLSGISHYEVSVNNSAPARVAAADILNNPYPLPAQDPGPNSVKVTAYDKAGNATSETAEYVVVGTPAPKLNPIDDVSSGEMPVITGLADPDSQVTIFLTDKDGNVTSQQVNAGERGEYKLLWKGKLAQGLYSARAQSLNLSTGAKSYKSEPQEFQVKLPAFMAWGIQALNFSSVILILLILLGLLLFGGWYIWHHFMGFRRRVINRSRMTSESLHAQFDELKAAIEEEVTALQEIKSKRDLTLEEERFLKRFTSMLEKAERALDRKISSIPK